MKKNTVKIRINGTAQEFTYNIRKDHRWHTRIQIGCKYNENGKPVYQYKHIYAQGELELKDKIREYFEDAEEKKNKKLIFELDILDWLYLYKFKKVRPTTYDRYEQVIKYQIIPAARATLSNKKVTEIKNDDCMRMLRWIADSECSVSTLKKAIMLLNSYFSNKVKNKTISDSPAGFKLRDIIFDADFSDQQVYFEDEDIIFLSDDEIKKVKEVIKNGYTISCIRKNGKPFSQKTTITQGDFFIFMLNTGIRTAEACGLRYSDVCWTNQTITIKNNITYVKNRDKNGMALGGYQKREGLPKTKESATTIKINKTSLDILKKMKASEPDGYEGYILHQDRNRSTAEVKSLLPNALYKRWKTVCRYADIPVRGVHCLRHSFASHLFHRTNGNALFVSQQLRHKDVAFTERVYVNILKKYRDEVFEDFEI